MEKIDFLTKYSSSVGIVYADVNGLKEINDTLGHQAGDAALRQAARLLTKCYGLENTYRIGGDEFLVLVPLVTELDFKTSVRRLRELAAGKADLSIAIGSEWVADTAQLERAITKTDQRMYCDKVEYYNRRGKKRDSPRPQRLPPHGRQKPANRGLTPSESAVGLSDDCLVLNALHCILGLLVIR